MKSALRTAIIGGSGQNQRMFSILLAVWFPLAPVQVARQEMAVAAVNGKVYALGVRP